MHKFLRWSFSFFLLLLPSCSGAAGAQSGQKDCAPVLSMDAEAYLNRAGAVSTAGMRETYGHWGMCRQRLLERHLAEYPKLKVRIAALREHYQVLRSTEVHYSCLTGGCGTLAYLTLSRQLALQERDLYRLAHLAMTKAGGEKAEKYAETVRAAKAKVSVVLGEMRALRVGVDTGISQSEWDAEVKAYAQASRAIMQALGDRGDAATALGYTILADQIAGEF